MTSLTSPSASRHLALCLLGLTTLLIWSGCASGPAGSRRAMDAAGHDAILELEVSPDDAEVYIDGAYSGQISRWRDHAVPVRSGSRRVELRAPHHITERFDLHIGANEIVTLEVALEPELALPEEEAQEPLDAPAPPRGSSTHRSSLPASGSNP